MYWWEMTLIVWVGLSAPTAVLIGKVLGSAENETASAAAVTAGRRRGLAAAGAANP